jgi:hypothetical protein
VSSPQRAHLDAVIGWLSLTTKDWFALKPFSWEQYPKRNRDEAAIPSLRFPWEEVDSCRSDTALQKYGFQPYQDGFLTRLRQFLPGHGRRPKCPALLHLSGHRRDRGREYARDARPCPECGDTFDQLTCVYYASRSSTWQKMCGRAGWLVVCDRCHVQVQFFLEVMN